MKRSKIETYQEQEKEKGRLVVGNLLNSYHVIKDATALYPEYELKKPFGLHRPGVNIAAMLFLYEQVIAYVPPINQKEFPNHFGVSFETFLQLSDPSASEQLIFPVLNHPRHYLNDKLRAELSPLLIKMPPTWERWHEALRISGGDVWFDKADSVYDYKKAINISDYRESRRKKLQTNSESIVSKEIKQQIRNNYTDLCLIGAEDVANDIAKLSHSDAPLALNDLLYSSELYAYPAVLGAGGIANIRLNRPSIRPKIPKNIRDKGYNPLNHFDGKVLDALFRGLKFDSIPSIMRVSFIKKWHKSGQAINARRAYGRLILTANERKADFEDIHGAVNTVLTELVNFCENAEPAEEELNTLVEERNRKISIFANTASIISGLIGFFAWPLLMWTTSTATTLAGVVGQTDRQKMMAKLLKRHFPDLPYEMYDRFSTIRPSNELLDMFTELDSESKDFNLTEPPTTFWH